MRGTLSLKNYAAQMSETCGIIKTLNKLMTGLGMHKTKAVV
ncbi:hypothetical protein BTN50_0812 [Candidatus Enterovibrio altilux]|uniref:Mobile element protein n=1 Tax=Candidatus Enterovibrio altilux TaxID=1927128 RepID=A0A291B8K7_9GAMM|nr:hypothetical protein BTN50_0812 [Candidatus Enterovibrio luxaltus]